MANRTNLNLDVDLQRGVVPISKAASSLAALIKRASNSGRPVIVTQKGYPTGVLLPVELFAALKRLAAEHDGLVIPTSQELDTIIESSDDEEAEPVVEVEEPEVKPRRKNRRRKSDQTETASDNDDV